MVSYLCSEECLMVFRILFLVVMMLLKVSGMLSGSFLNICVSIVCVVLMLWLSVLL